MTSNNLTVEKLEKNWETYKGLIIKCCGANGERLLDDLGERLVMCPVFSKIISIRSISRWNDRALNFSSNANEENK